MDIAAVFADLNQHPWPRLSHAYGSAEDIPGLLRALASADAEAAAEAEDELWGSIVHQGTVYEASVYAVPYLARLAATGVRSANLLGLLGSIAESTDEHGLSAPGAAREAVAAQLPLLLPLLADADSQVRQCAVWTVAQCRSAAGEAARAAVQQRWQVETDPVVRADVLTACVLLDRDRSAGLARATLTEGEPAPVRVAAVLACLEPGTPWDSHLADVVVGLLPLREHSAGSLWEREPLGTVVERLHARGEVGAAVDLVVSALQRATAAQAPVGDTRTSEPAATEAVWAAGKLARCSRSAPTRLLPAMLPLLEAPSTAGHAIDAIRNWGQPAPQAVPRLVHIAATEGALADRALAALVHLGVPEAADLLARDIQARPRALGAACGYPTSEPVAPLPCTPALLAAVRGRLTDASLGQRKSADLSALTAVNEPIHLAGLLAGWGSAARAALPELLDALPRHPLPVARALAAIADTRTDPHVVAVLREHANHKNQQDSQATTTALHALTGDPGPLLAILGTALGEPGNNREHTVQAVARLGEQARPLLPQLLALLAEPVQVRQTTPAIKAALEAAVLVWELTGDDEPVLPIVLEGLARGDQLWGRWTAIRAAEVAALLGPAAEPAVPYLLQMLDRREQAAAAARTLCALYPESSAPAGVSRTELVDRVLAAADPGASLNTALAAVRALADLGPGAFTPAQLERVRLLADGDQRIVGSGIEDQIIRDDEKFRSEARAVLDTLRP